MRKRLIASLCGLALLGGGAIGYAAMTPAAASVPEGRFIDVGCSKIYNVIVYTVVDKNGVPTGVMSVKGWGCRHTDADGLDLQPYVTIVKDQFGNIVVREYKSRAAGGPPIAMDVVAGWERGGPPFSWDQVAPAA